MFTGMTLAVLLAILAVFSSLVGVWDKLTSKVPRLVILAVFLISLTAPSQVILTISQST